MISIVLDTSQFKTVRPVGLAIAKCDSDIGGGWADVLSVVKWVSLTVLHRTTDCRNYNGASMQKMAIVHPLTGVDPVAFSYYRARCRQESPAHPRMLL
jgi:hypothetical protein